jgi:hypothetical protein
MIVVFGVADAGRAKNRIASDHKKCELFKPKEGARATIIHYSGRRSENGIHLSKTM